VRFFADAGQEFRTVVYREIQRYGPCGDARTPPADAARSVACTDDPYVELAAGDTSKLSHCNLSCLKLLDDRSALLQQFRSRRGEVDLLAELFE